MASPVSYLQTIATGLSTNTLLGLGSGASQPALPTPSTSSTGALDSYGGTVEPPPFTLQSTALTISGEAALVGTATRDGKSAAPAVQPPASSKPAAPAAGTPAPVAPSASTYGTSLSETKRTLDASA